MTLFFPWSKSRAAGAEQPWRPTYFTARWLFLRFLAAIYLIAFLSLGTQISGLVGSRGIVPVETFLDSLRHQVGPQRYWLVPTLFWLDASDGFLTFMCGAGVFFSLLVILGVAEVPGLFLLWATYLSFATICGDFLGFQWDNLLLEAGFLAIFLAPRQTLAKAAEKFPPSSAVLWLFRLLLFKLVFSSGVVKLASGDAVWRNLTALRFHYETQPLPTWIGWYLHQMPLGFQKISAVGMFVAELAVPFFIFAPRRFRLFACAMLVLFQILIMATGNYCFFNLTTVALCILLVDDETWPLRQLKKRLTFLNVDTPSRSRGWPKWVVGPLVAVFVLISAIEILGTFRWRIPWPPAIVRLYDWLSPFRTVNNYGLFAVMTTSRPEIIVEGSEDGATWLAYEFKFKPGDLNEKPRFVQPHQPRLDWQMWFAALGSYKDNLWFISFLRRLLEGSPDVLALLHHNPFPNAPPRYIRAVIYDYRFTDLDMKRRSGAWWRRDGKRLYCPSLSLK